MLFKFAAALMVLCATGFADSYGDNCIFGGGADCVDAGMHDYLRGHKDRGEDHFTVGCKKKKDAVSCLALQCFKKNSCEKPATRALLEPMCQVGNVSACVFLSAIERATALELPYEGCEEAQIKALVEERSRRFEVGLSLHGPFCEGANKALTLRIALKRESERQWEPLFQMDLKSCLGGYTVNCQNVIRQLPGEEALDVIEAACIKHVRTAAFGVFYCEILLNTDRPLDPGPHLRKIMLAMCHWPKGLCKDSAGVDCRFLKQKVCQAAKGS